MHPVLEAKYLKQEVPKVLSIKLGSLLIHNNNNNNNNNIKLKTN
jgi:hypothetical protein